MRVKHGVDLDQTLRSVTPDLGLCCLLRYVCPNMRTIPPPTPPTPPPPPPPPKPNRTHTAVVIYSTDRSKAVVPELVLLFVVYSTRRFVLSCLMLFCSCIFQSF